MLTSVPGREFKKMSERLTVVEKVLARLEGQITEGEKRAIGRIKKLLQESTKQLIASSLPVPPVQLIIEDPEETTKIDLKPEEAVLVVGETKYRPLGTAERDVILKPDGKLYFLDVELGIHSTDGDENEVIWEPVWQGEIKTRDYLEFGPEAIRKVEKLTESNRTVLGHLV